MNALGTQARHQGVDRVGLIVKAQDGHTGGRDDGGCGAREFEGGR